MPTPTSNVVRFGVFELDKDSGELRRHGLKIRLPDQSFQILKLLLSRPGEVVTRDDLRHALWTSDNTHVDFEVGLNSAVRKLREALQDSPENPQFVETLPRRGYRFIASVAPAVVAEVSAAAATAIAAPVPEAAAEPPPAATPEPALAVRRVARGAALGLAAAVLVAATIGAGFVYQRGGFSGGRAAPAAEPIRSVVVLPFENLTGDPAQEHFVDSVTDAVTAHLAQAGLDVISRTSARQYKLTGKRLPEIGNELQVDGVVEGAVARSGAGVRITAKLIRAATDRNVWAQIYEEDVRGMLMVQQRIASDVAVAAGRPRPAGGRTGHAVEPRAYNSYVKGLLATGLQRHEGFLRAVTYFEEAIRVQPDFGEAYAALAHAQVQLLFGGPLSPHQTIPKAEAAARKALQLDDTLSQAHWALGQILTLYHWRWKEGAESLQRAAVLSGGRNELSTAVSESHIRLRQVAEAIAAAERGRKLDPLSVSAQIAVGNAYRAAGQHDRAIAELRRALAMSPGHSRVFFHLGVTYVAMGRLDDAIRELEAAVRLTQAHNSRVEAYLGYAYAAAHRTIDARKVLAELESHRRDQYVSSFGVALIYDALGEQASALTALQRAFDDRAVEFAQMLQYPPFTTIASEPAFLAIMREVGLPR